MAGHGHEDENRVGWEYLCSLAEACDVAEVSKRTMLRRIAAGRLAAKKVGSQWVIDVRTVGVATPLSRLRRLRLGLAPASHSDGSYSNTTSATITYSSGSNSGTVWWVGGGDSASA